MEICSCITAPIYRITENEGYMKTEAVRLGVYKTISLAVKHHGHGVSAQISIMQSLQYYDHLSEPMAECLFALATQYDHTQLCDDILRDIAMKSFSAQDTKGPRHFSRFLVKLAQLQPRAVLKQISLLLTHLDSEVGALNNNNKRLFIKDTSGIPNANRYSRGDWSAHS